MACLLTAALAPGLILELEAQGRAGSRPAQTGPQEQAPQDFFIDTVNVSVVNVDVYVTDKKGNRINGLTKDDFEVFENGKPVAITNFYAVEGGKAVHSAPAEATETPQAPQVPGMPTLDQVETPEDQRLRLVIYIDNFNIHPFNRNRVMRELRIFLTQKLSRGDSVMLVSYDRSLKVRRNFTVDPDLIASALTELEKVTGAAVHQESDFKQAIRNIEESQSAGEAMMYARSFAESTYNDLQFTIGALKETVDGLAGLPGRKAILYVSDGLPMTAGQEVFYAVQNKYGTQGASLTESFSFDASRRYAELAAQANANRVTFYTIDAAGLRTYSSISAENSAPMEGGVMIDSIKISNLQSTLQFLAEKTGGMAVLNSNVVLPQLEKIGQDFNTYYSLGYSPTHFGDGRYHKIEVKVKGRKGLIVRHREGYRDKPVESRMNDATLATLHFPFEENPMGIDIDFGQVTRREDGLYLLPVNVRIPLDKVTLVPRDTTNEARLRLFLAAMDSGGDTSEVQNQLVPISIPNADLEKAKGKYYVYSVSLLMRGGDHKVGVGVRDDVAGESSFLSRSVRIGAPRNG
jgi:VWFA-related protein